ncbi:hypothetical protein [Nocardiopsis aegyptia]|uniref:Uncharacterized protein n=1 Tax=Nocardiopsis aegyptia TaxID=220378 RepID=A0A7Z0J9P9_9ACTN|nr:hypothetical protein [Nocardiopsis aegyptia]NYJ33615.1 hypothetical protein [Nocardiopsis aegyptia]
MSRAGTAAAACALVLAQVGGSPVWAGPAPARTEARVMEARHDHRPVDSAPVLELEAPRLGLEAPDEDVEMPVEPLEDTEEGS